VTTDEPRAPESAPKAAPPVVPVWRHVVDPLLLAARLYFGVQLCMIGALKLLDLENTRVFFESLGLPFPAVNAVAAGLTESVGGALLAAGFVARLSSLPVMFCMLVAYASAHRSEAFYAAKPFWFFVAALLVLVLGAGRWSVDGQLAARRAAIA
jgi:putative oxidoreductase